MANPPFDIAHTVPADADFVAPFPATERLFRDIVESWLTLEHDATTGRHKIPVDTTANLNGLSYPANGALVWDTTLGRLKVRVASAFAIVEEFPTGTRMAFQQVNAPTGWTKETGAAFHDSAIKLKTDATVTTGGSVAFPTAFASRALSGTVQGHVLTASELPAHAHVLAFDGSTVSALSAGDALYTTSQPGNNNDYVLAGLANTPNVGLSGFVGGNANHDHPLAMNNLDLNVKFVDFIIAQKN